MYEFIFVKILTFFFEQTLFVKKRKTCCDTRDSTKTPTSSQKTKIARKNLGNASLSRKTTCDMCVNWFMDTNTGAFYLCHSSVLDHRYHSRVEEEDILLTEDDMNEDQRNFVIRMHQEGVGPTSISTIMTKILNDNGINGEFTPSAMKNATRRMQLAIDELDGIVGGDYTIAEKSIKKLNAYAIPMSLCFGLWTNLLYVLFRLNVSHVMLTMAPNGDLHQIRNRGRPKSVTTVIPCSDNLKSELSLLFSEMGYKKGTEILLALSIATDEMTRHVQMFPEVFYLDVTANTNRQKRNLLLMVVKDANGETFIGNATVIPSEKRWVFHRIYHDFFVILYGCHTIMRNRLILTDDDDAEHGPLDNLIDTTECYKRTLHMLCIFHAIVMPYKEQVHPKLPRKPGNSKEVTALGDAYGETTPCVQSFVF